MIGILYPDEYAVEETFQLLKIPWEWYDSSKDYGVVIAKCEDLKSGDVNLIDLSGDDVFKKVSNLLNLGIEHDYFCKGEKMDRILCKTCKRNYLKT